ncbi:MAG: bifunctional helix-turn-helix transcriptional regulator/GNAT family N-acetyltransferase [Rubrivivax sp.]
MTTAQPQPAAEAAAAEVRRFNRFYTRLLGLLDEHLLASAFSLTEMRVLYELAQVPPTAEAPAPSELARALGLDAAYLSRLLRRFDAQGFLKREAHAADSRRQHLRLTRAGLAAFKPLDRASQQQVLDLLQPLAPPQVAELVAAMQRVQQLLSPPPAQAMAQPPYLLRGLEIGDIGWIIRRQGQLYAQEYGWDLQFEALVAEIAAGFVKGFDARHERAWVAEREGQVVGSVFCVKVNAHEAKLRLLYVEPAARGLGIGARLVDECIRFAREKGYRRLTLWTNDILVAARRIYEARGFVLVEEEPHHSFGHDLVGQYWRLDLKAAPAAAPR